MRIWRRVPYGLLYNDHNLVRGVDVCICQSYLMTWSWYHWHLARRLSRIALQKSYLLPSLVALGHLEMEIFLLDKFTRLHYDDDKVNITWGGLSRGLLSTGWIFYPSLITVESPGKQSLQISRRPKLSTALAVANRQH